MENSYPNLTCSTLVPEANSSYLASTHTPTIATPLGGPTMALMMMASTLQYQLPYLNINSNYSYAMWQASKAAFVQSGGQEVQDKTLATVTKNGMNFAHSIGVTDTELGVVGFTAKTIRSRTLNVKGPKIYEIKTNLTGSPGNASIGLTYEW